MPLNCRASVICCGTFVLHLPPLSGHSSAGHHPLSCLAGDIRDEVIVAVVMEHGHPFPLCQGRDQQVREADRPHVPATPQRGLDVQGVPPVLIMSRQPLVTGVPVGAQLVELLAAPARPAKLKFARYISGEATQIYRLGWSPFVGQEGRAAARFKAPTGTAGLICRLPLELVGGVS